MIAVQCRTLTDRPLLGWSGGIPVAVTGRNLCCILAREAKQVVHIYIIYVWAMFCMNHGQCVRWWTAGHEEGACISGSICCLSVECGTSDTKCIFLYVGDSQQDANSSIHNNNQGIRLCASPFP